MRITITFYINDLHHILDRMLWIASSSRTLFPQVWSFRGRRHFNRLHKYRRDIERPSVVPTVAMFGVTTNAVRLWPILAIWRKDMVQVILTVRWLTTALIKYVKILPHPAYSAPAWTSSGGSEAPTRRQIIRQGDSDARNWPPTITTRKHLIANDGEHHDLFIQRSVSTTM